MTKEQLKEQINSMHEGDIFTLRGKLNNIIDTVFDRIEAIENINDTVSDRVEAIEESAFVTGGTGTAAAIAALVAPKLNAIYRVITTGGDLNADAETITVAVGDLVYHNGTLWVLLADVNA